MFKIFIGIILMCCSFGNYTQFLLPLIGAGIVAFELNRMRAIHDNYNMSLAATVIFAAYQVISAVLYKLPIYETSNFSSYLYAGSTVLLCVLLASLYISFKNEYGRKVYGIFCLMAMNVGCAAVILLGPVLNLGYDVITIAMAVLIYAFVFGFIAVDLRLMYLADEE